MHVTTHEISMKSSNISDRIVIHDIEIFERILNVNLKIKHPGPSFS